MAKKTSESAISDGIPQDGGGAAEELRQYRRRWPQELGVHRRCCTSGATSWNRSRTARDAARAAGQRSSLLRENRSRLKRLLAEKTLEVDFFKGALQKVEARRQSNSDSGEKASTTKSGKLMSMQGNLSIERMCQLASVSRAGFYRSLQEQSAGGRRHGSAVGDSADRAGTQAPLWIPADHRRAAPPRDAGESQARGAADARGQLAGRAAAGVRGDDGFRSRVGGLSQSGQADEADRQSTSCGWPTSLISGCRASASTWR